MTRWPPPPRSLAGEHAPLEVLDEAACRELLDSAAIGRVAVSMPDGTCLVVPVNFTVEDSGVLFRTAPGAVMDHLGQRATFQADAVDPWHHVGWSVLVHGRVSLVTGPAAEKHGPDPWPEGHDRFLVSIDIERITGRVLRAAPYAWDPRGYL